MFDSVNKRLPLPMLFDSEDYHAGDALRRLSSDLSEVLTNNVFGQLKRLFWTPYKRSLVWNLH